MGLHGLEEAGQRQAGISATTVVPGDCGESVPSPRQEPPVADGIDRTTSRPDARARQRCGTRPTTSTYEAKSRREAVTRPALLPRHALRGDRLHAGDFKKGNVDARRARPSPLAPDSPR